MEMIRDVIVNLLENLGSRREIDHYLREFTSVEATKFAVIKVGGGILRDSIGDLASSLAFLRRVGLFPIVVHGAGPQIDEALRNEGIASPIIDGLRVTDESTLRVARRVLQRESLKLVDALEERGVRARPLGSAVFEAAPLDQDKYGFVGKVTNVDVEPIRAAIRTGHLPILTCLGETGSGQILNINADVAARELATTIRPYKIIFLTPTGGLLDDQGKVIPAVNIEDDADQLLDEPWVSGGMALKLREILALLEQLPPTSSVAITSPTHLARELFTHRGHGTLIRRGVRITTASTLDELDVDRLGTCVASAFDRPLKDGYFEGLDPELLLVGGDYESAAIIHKDDPAPYLDKFAVNARAQGIGLGASLWRRIRETLPCLYWRARPDNPITPWYFLRADGMHRTPEWIVFWYGLSDADVIERCVRKALNREETLALTPSVHVEAARV